MIRPPLFKRWLTLFTGKISIHWTKSSSFSPLSFSEIVEHQRAGKSPAARKVTRLSSARRFSRSRVICSLWYLLGKWGTSCPPDNSTSFLNKGAHLLDSDLTTRAGQVTNLYDAYKKRQRNGYFQLGCVPWAPQAATGGRWRGTGSCMISWSRSRVKWHGSHLTLTDLRHHQTNHCETTCHVAKDKMTYRGKCTGFPCALVSVVIYSPLRTN